MSVGSFGISEGNMTRKKRTTTAENTHTHTEYTPNCNCQQRSDADACVIHKTVRVGQGGAGYILCP